MGRATGESTTLVSVRISPSFKSECNNKAKLESLSLNEWVRRAMVDRLAGNGNRDDKKRIAELEVEVNNAREEGERLKSEALKTEYIWEKLREGQNHLAYVIQDKDRIINELRAENDKLRKSYGVLEDPSIKETLAFIEDLAESNTLRYLKMIAEAIDEGEITHFTINGKRYCTYCGATLQPDELTCHKCGQRL